MGAMKRKDHDPSAHKATRPAKRLRVSHLGSQNGTKPEAIAGKPAKVKSAGTAPVSMLRKEEPEFLRGGGDILTPLERKQIQAQATRDVLFEQKAGGAVSDASEDEGAITDDGELTKPLRTTKKSGKKKKDQKSKASEDSESRGVRVEGLNYKVRELEQHDRNRNTCRVGAVPHDADPLTVCLLLLHIITQCAPFWWPTRGPVAIHSDPLVAYLGVCLVLSYSVSICICKATSFRSQSLH